MVEPTHDRLTRSVPPHAVGSGPTFALHGAMRRGERLLLPAALLLVSWIAACDAAVDEAPSLHVGASWQQIRQVEGHRVHVVEEAVACAECHDLRGETIDRPTAASCLGTCHEEEAKIEHARAEARRHFGPDAPSDCMACHSFVHAPGQTEDHWEWDCLRCHEEPLGDTPAVVIHRQSTCDSCHQPHAGVGQQVQPSDCRACHDDIATTHASGDKKPAEVCTTCHQHQHEEALHARTSCAKCHAEEEPIISEAALFEGHNECTGCHRPHDYAKADALGCRKCHEDTPVLGGGRIAAHETCKNCHDAHDVRGAITQACVGCHTERSTNHPKPKQGEVCSACHDPHPPSGRVSPARACSDCHQAAANDADFHGKDCKDCHTPHEFVVTAGSDNLLCKSCHSASVTKVSTVTAHTQCSACHTGLPHRPATSDTCASLGCHATVQAVLPAKHTPCASCHEPHGGALLKTCGQCHGEQRARATAGHQACRSCHDEHTAKSTKTCTSCHGAVASQPHGSLKGGCETCHSAHDRKGVTFAASCTSCHPTAKLPALHTVSQHQACATCHLTHRRAYTNERQACTTGCHLDLQNHEPSTNRCSGCHLFK